MPAGRPLKFNTPMEIYDKGMAYFTDMEAQGRPKTITGLCIALGTYRDVLMDYQDERGEEFSNAVKVLKIRCENYAEEQVFIGKNCAGAIFALKNYGWKDKQEQEVTGKDGAPLIPQVNIIGYKDSLTIEHAKPRPQDLVEELRRPALDEADQGPTST